MKKDKQEEIKPKEIKYEEPKTQEFGDVPFDPVRRADILIIKYVETTTVLKPTLLSSQIILWKDTTLNKYYLLANFNGVSKKVELT